LSFLATKDYALQKDYTSTREIEEFSLKDQCQYCQFLGQLQRAFLDSSHLYLKRTNETNKPIPFLFLARRLAPKQRKFKARKDIPQVTKGFGTGRHIDYGDSIGSLETRVSSHCARLLMVTENLLDFGYSAKGIFEMHRGTTGHH